MRSSRSGVFAAGPALALLLALANCSGAPARTISAATEPTTTPTHTSSTIPLRSAAMRGSLVPVGQADQPATTTTPGSTGSSTAGSGGRVLAGRVITVDPGHDGGNAAHPRETNRLVNVITKWKPCDATGTETNSGYSEHAFTWDVANRLAAVLRARGATVVLTRPNDTGWGPCNTDRAAIGNRAHSDAAISIHADGGPANGRGFHVIAPGAVRGNEMIIAPSARLATEVRAAFKAGTGMPYATYLAEGRGLTVRTDLGGLNLSQVPKVFIECGNMRQSTDAALLRSASWRQQAAVALADGLTTYLS